MRAWKQFIVFGLVVGSGFWFCERQRERRATSEDRLLETRLIQSSETDRIPFSAKCDTSEAGQITFTARVRTTQRLALHHGLQKHPEHLALAQMKFLSGFFHFSEYEGVRLNILSPPRVEVLRTSSTRYGVDLSLDRVETDDESNYPPRYIPRVLAPDTKAFEVEYRASVPVIGCLRRDRPFRVLSLRLPIDPYLAFWYVKKSDHKLVSWMGISTSTNPCAYEQMADLKRPSFYWYVWNPLKQGQQYDCRVLIGDDKVARIDAEFRADDLPRTDYSLTGKLPDGPIKIALIFGYLAPTNESTANEIRGKLEDFGKTPNLAVLDPGVRIASGMLHLLSQISNLEPWKLKDSKDSFEFTTTGRLKESGRSVEIEVFLGPTVDYHAGVKHWDFLSRALSRSTFIFYNGHAGMGSTFSLKGLRNYGLTEPSPEDLPRFQFIGVLSCFATDYFGKDFAQLRSRSGQTTDIMLAGFEGHSFMMIPAVLQYLDVSLSGKSASLKKSMERYLAVDQFVHVRRFVAP